MTQSSSAAAAEHADATNKSFTITDNRTGRSWELPVFDGSQGPSVVDVRKFFADTGSFTYDPGYSSTASCESKITFIDGEKVIFEVMAVLGAEESLARIKDQLTESEAS